MTPTRSLQFLGRLMPPNSDPASGQDIKDKRACPGAFSSSRCLSKRHHEIIGVNDLMHSGLRMGSVSHVSTSVVHSLLLRWTEGVIRTRCKDPAFSQGLPSLVAESMGFRSGQILGTSSTSHCNHRCQLLKLGSPYDWPARSGNLGRAAGMRFFQFQRTAGDQGGSTAFPAGPSPSPCPNSFQTTQPLWPT